MQMKAIKEGMHVQTPMGPGVVLKSDKTFPPSVKVEVQMAFGPPQVRLFEPRDISPAPYDPARS